MSNALTNAITKIDRGEELTLAAEKLRAALEGPASFIAETVPTVIQWLTENMPRIIEDGLTENMPRIIEDGLAVSRVNNRRVKHLAYYGRKHRTRKKNMHRAYKILEKGAER